MLNQTILTFLEQLAKGIALQFGTNCEVVIHDLSDNYKDNSIVAIENGHVTSRKIGDGPSMAVLDALHGDQSKLKDHISYLTKTKDGRILKSTTIYIRDPEKKVIGIFSINFDITNLMMIENALNPLISVTSSANETSSIPLNVNDLLTNLIEESARQVGKPVPLMTREDKIQAIKFLNDRGALLITKAGDKISKYFGISKYTLYSYIDSDDE
jgi:predicted transcriptional regulator YheO